MAPRIDLEIGHNPLSENGGSGAAGKEKHHLTAGEDEVDQHGVQHGGVGGEQGPRRG